MAGEGIVVNGVIEILERLITVVVKEIGLATSVKEELKNLQYTLNMILSVMTSAERNQLDVAHHHHHNRRLMKDLKAVAYEADDILDEFSYEIMQRRENHGPYNKVRSNFFFFSSVFKPKFFQYMGHKIKDINEKFNNISNRGYWMGLGLDAYRNMNPETRSKKNMNPETYSYVNASKIFGRENDKSNIIEMLRMDGGETVSVIPIVGIGGLGKTTLAQLVYNEDVSIFDVKMWVCVTPTFNVKKIFQNITESITGSKCEDVSSLEVLVTRLQQHLMGKKFLLVLDDVLDVDQEEWDKLKDPLTVGGVGSKIIITTRSQTVASTVIGVESRFPAYYPLQRLEDSECWSIFTQRAFGASGGAAKTPNLVTIGKKLLTRCEGLPLAVHFVGNLCRNVEEIEWENEDNIEKWYERVKEEIMRNSFILYGSVEWETIRNSEIRYKSVERDENRIVSVLKLSYDHLPSHLKQCFSYCSIFPKNTELKRETLIELWIAEGFLFQSDGTNEMSLKEIGSMYFKYLLNNSFFQDVHDYGETLTCKMHDLVHDLAQSVSGFKECLIMAERTAHNMQYISETRRLRLVNLDGELPDATLSKLNDAKELRSLFVNVQIGRSMKIIASVIDNNKLLRVLDLSGTDLEALPPSIGNLIHLRYLDLSRTNIEMLPESFSKLYNLRTLKLVATKLPRVPKGMENLSNLKHFKFTLRMLECQEKTYIQAFDEAICYK